MKRTARIHTLDQCMDVFDWFNDPVFDTIYHIWASKPDAETRLAHALPELIQRASRLVKIHRGFEDAYPENHLAA